MTVSPSCSLPHTRASHFEFSQFSACSVHGKVPVLREVMTRVKDYVGEAKFSFNILYPHNSGGGPDLLSKLKITKSALVLYYE